MLYVILICCVIIITVVLLKKYVLKIDYSEYSKENSRLQDLIKTEKFEDDEIEK